MWCWQSLYRAPLVQGVSQLECIVLAAADRLFIPKTILNRRYGQLLQIRGWGTQLTKRLGTLGVLRVGACVASWCMPGHVLQLWNGLWVGLLAVPGGPSGVREDNHPTQRPPGFCSCVVWTCNYNMITPHYNISILQENYHHHTNSAEWWLEIIMISPDKIIWTINYSACNSDLKLPKKCNNYYTFFIFYIDNIP